MPWIQAGDVSPTKGNVGVISVANANVTFIAARIVGSSGFSPLHWGFLSWYGPSTMPDTSTIVWQRGNAAMWSPAIIVPALPNGASLVLSRIAYFRVNPAVGAITLRAYYFTP